MFILYNVFIESDTNKSNTSIVDISAVSKSISNAKFNPSRSYIQDIKGSRDFGNTRFTLNKKNQSTLSRDFTLKNLGKDSHREILNTNEDEEEDNESEEEDNKDLTNENILIGLNSPRPMNCMNSYRNHPSNKKDTELSINSLNKLNGHTSSTKNGIQPTLTIDLCDINDTDNVKTTETDEENNGYFTRKDKALVYTSNDGGFNFSASSIETKKKNGSLNNLDSEFQSRKTSNPMLRYDQRKNTLGGFESSKGMLFVSDFADEGNLANSVHDFSKSVHDFNKNSFCGNPTISRDIFGASKNNNLHCTQQSVSDFNDYAQNKENYPENKIKFLENRLREAEHKNEKILLEKERLKVELDRLILELKQTKMEWALSEESKEESELTLKNEIKFLLNKLLQVKNMNSSSHSDLSQFTKSTLNKSTIDPHSTSFNNTSSSLNLTHLHHPAHSISFNSNYHGSHEKKFLNPPQRSVTEKSTTPTPLREKSQNSPRFETVGDSPRRETEFQATENSLLMSLLNVGSNAKKLVGTLKR